MQRLILRHLTGSKSGTTDAFPLDSVRELTLGRDPLAHVPFDVNRDDLVGRQHARIVRDPDDPAKFSLTDLSSRNGTFIDKARIDGTVPLVPGHVIQLGAGGPEFRFEIDPLPEAYAKATRRGDAADGRAESRSPSPSPSATASC